MSPFAMLALVLILSTTVQDTDGPWSIIERAPKKYQRMLRAFKYKDFKKIREYCQPTLRIESCNLIRPSELGYKEHYSKKLDLSFCRKVHMARRDSMNKMDRNYLNRKFQDFSEGLMALRMGDNFSKFLPDSGPLDIMPKSGFGYPCRPCAGYFVRLQIDPKDAKHPICGWFETIR